MVGRDRRTSSGAANGRRIAILPPVFPDAECGSAETPFARQKTPALSSCLWLEARRRTLRSRRRSPLQRRETAFFLSALAEPRMRGGYADRRRVRPSRPPPARR